MVVTRYRRLEARRNSDFMYSCVEYVGNQGTKAKVGALEGYNAIGDEQLGCRAAGARRAKEVPYATNKCLWCLDSGGWLNLGAAAGVCRT